MKKNTEHSTKGLAYSQCLVFSGSCYTFCGSELSGPVMSAGGYPT